MDEPQFLPLLLIHRGSPFCLKRETAEPLLTHPYPVAPALCLPFLPLGSWGSSGNATVRPGPPRAAPTAPSARVAGAGPAGGRGRHGPRLWVCGPRGGRRRPAPVCASSGGREGRATAALGTLLGARAPSGCHRGPDLTRCAARSQVGLRRRRPAPSLCPRKAAGGAVRQRQASSTPTSRLRPARVPRCPGSRAGWRPGRGLRWECGRGCGRGRGEQRGRASPRCAGVPGASTCASYARFSRQLCLPSLRTSSAGQWSQDLSLNRKLEPGEEAAEEGARRSRVRVRLIEAVVASRTFLGALPRPGERILLQSPAGPGWALVLPPRTCGETGVGVGERMQLSLAELRLFGFSVTAILTLPATFPVGPRFAAQWAPCLLPG